MTCEMITCEAIHKYNRPPRCSLMIQGVFFFTGTPPKISKYKKLISASLGVSRPIYVNVDSPNLGFPYFYLLGEAQWKKHTL